MEIIELTPAKKEGDVIEITPAIETKPTNIAKSSGEFNEPAIEEVDLTAGENIKGGLNAVGQGATLGFGEEIQSIIAAAVASPFISDKTFSQLMIDARTSLRDEQGAFKEANPKTAFGLEVAGGILTGTGAAKAAGTGLKEVAKHGAKIGAGTGAIAGTGFADADEFLSLDTALSTTIGGVAGAGLGALLPVAISSVSKTLRNFTGKPSIKIFDDNGKFTKEAIDELDSMVKGGKATPEEIDALIAQNLQKEKVLLPEHMDRFNLFKSRDITPTRANVTQSVDDFRDHQTALKRSGAVSETVAGQDAQIIKTVNDGIDNIAPAATNVLETNSNVFSVVDDVTTKFDDAVSNAYQIAKTESQGKPLVSFDNLMSSISNNRGKEKVSGGVISAIKQTLKNKGLIKKGSDLNISRRSQRIAGEDIKKLSVKEAEEIRQELNGLFDGASPQGRKLIRDLKDALDNDVAGAVGEDIFRDARLAKIRFHELIERGSRNKFDKSRGGFLEDVINNKIPEEKILPKLLNGRDDDLIKMKQFLTQDAGESGIQAWNDIKAQTLRNALDKATGTIGKGEGGQSIFNSRLFKNELQKLRSSKKFTELFNADEISLIDDIIEIGRLRVPQGNVFLGDGATSPAVEKATNIILKKIPIIGERATDLFQALSNAKTDRRLLDVTKETAEALSR